MTLHGTKRPSTTDPKVDVLRRVPALHGYSDRDLARLASLFDEVEFASGDVLIREGRPGTEAFLLVDGRATVTIEGRPIAGIGAGDVVGEMALLDRSLRSATVTADTPVQALALTPTTFTSLMNEPGVARRVAASIAQRLRELEGAPSYDTTGAR